MGELGSWEDRLAKDLSVAGSINCFEIGGTERFFPSRQTRSIGYLFLTTTSSFPRLNARRSGSSSTSQLSGRVAAVVCLQSRNSVGVSDPTAATVVYRSSSQIYSNISPSGTQREAPPEQVVP